MILQVPVEWNTPKKTIAKTFSAFSYLPKKTIPQKTAILPENQQLALKNELVGALKPYDSRAKSHHGPPGKESIIYGYSQQPTSPTLTWKNPSKNKASAGHVFWREYVGQGAGVVDQHIPGWKFQKKSKPPASWWFQPVWKILVKLDHFPR